MARPRLSAEPRIKLLIRLTESEKRKILAAAPPGVSDNAWIVRMLLDAAGEPPSISEGEIDRLAARAASTFAEAVRRKLLGMVR